MKAGYAKTAHTPLARSELPVDTAALARFLIGKLLVRELPEGVASGRIVETEAYVIGDAAGHAYGGMTPRNRALFLERGHAYVYFAYGVSWMLNVSSEAPGIGAGVLIRALEPLEGIAIMANNRGTERLRDLARGPGRLAQALRIDRSLDGLDLCEEGPFGLRAMTTTPARSARGKSERASGLAFRGTPTGFYGFTFATARSSAAPSRSTDEPLRCADGRGGKGTGPPPLPKCLHPTLSAKTKLRAATLRYAPSFRRSRSTIMCAISGNRFRPGGSSSARPGALTPACSRASPRDLRSHS